MSTKVKLAVVPVSMAAMCAMALAHGGDVGLRVEHGAITTWEADHGPPVHFEEPERVFVGDLDFHGGVVEGHEPGFLVESGSPLGGHQLGFNIRAAARSWSVSSQNFHTISPYSITIERALIGSVTTPAADPATPLTGLSFNLPATGADFHYDFVLNGTTPGLYLLELEKWTAAPGIATSKPFWIVLNYDMPHSQEDAAVHWVEHYLVPAPGALAVLGLAAMAGMRRRR